MKPLFDTKPRGRAAFTLVEMLVVVVIVAILAGVAFKLIKNVGDIQRKAITIARLQRIKLAIEAFKQEYGQYPPVDSSQTPGNRIRYAFPDEWTIGSVMIPAQRNFGDPQGDYFHFGLMSYLLPRWKLDGYHISNGRRVPRVAPRYNLDNVLAKSPNVIRANNQWGDNNKNDRGTAVATSLDRDVQAAEKWMDYIDDILWPYIPPGQQFPLQPVPDVLRNDGLEVQPGGYCIQIITILDGWAQEYHYYSEPPYTSYKLWSTAGGAPKENWIYGNIGE